MYFIYNARERAWLMSWQWSPSGFRTFLWGSCREDARLFERMYEAATLADAIGPGAEVYKLGLVNGRTVAIRVEIGGKKR